MLIGSAIHIDVTYEADNGEDVYDGGRLLVYCNGQIFSSRFIGCTSLIRRRVLN